jgi:hypothetical protein
MMSSKDNNKNNESQDKECLEASPVPGYVAADHPQLQPLKRHRQPGSLANTPKKRQRSCATRDQIVNKYKQDLSSVWVDKPVEKSPWFKPEGLVLDCKSADPQCLPSGFTSVGQDRFHYNFTDPESRTGKRYRPVAYRVPFLKDEGFHDMLLTVSHLCHNNWCYNWNHHALESLEKNKARNGCPGGPSCRHKTRCRIPGEFSEDESRLRCKNRSDRLAGQTYEFKKKKRFRLFHRTPTFDSLGGSNIPQVESHSYSRRLPALG